MTEEERMSKSPGPFNGRRYSQGFRHAIEDREEGDSIEAMEAYAKTMSGRTWYSIGHNSAINGIKEGQAI